jgi:hypothetical protein
MLVALSALSRVSSSGDAGATARAVAGEAGELGILFWPAPAPAPAPAAIAIGLAGGGGIGSVVEPDDDAADALGALAAARGVDPDAEGSAEEGSDGLSASDAPQKRQNWAFASHWPRHRAHTRTVSGACGVESDTTRAGAITCAVGAS